MDNDRRKLLVAALGATAISSSSRVFATADEMQAAIQAIAGDARITENAERGPLTLTVPEIAENGFSVPISVSVDSVMTADLYVKSVAVFADANPGPEVVKFNFTEYSGEAFAATRMRLATTQNVVAVATLSDGTVFIHTRHVHVTVGGCGI